MRSRPRNVNPSPWRSVQTETRADRIALEFNAGASVDELKRKYIGYDVDAIIRERVRPGGER